MVWKLARLLSFAGRRIVKVGMILNELSINLMQYDIDRSNVDPVDRVIDSEVHNSIWN